jgi:flagellar FliL protein
MAEEDDDTKPAKKGNAKKKIVMAVAGLVLLGTGVGGSLYFTGMLGGPHDKAAAEAEAKKQEEHKDVAIYFAFPDPFTVNFETDQGLRFLQVSLEVMSYQQEAIDGIQTHMPVIKNNIILLLSNQSYGTLVSLEGKEKIRQDVLNEIQGILTKHKIKAKVQEVYFTTFVMQ